MRAVQVCVVHKSCTRGEIREQQSVSFVKLNLQSHMHTTVERATSQIMYYGSTVCTLHKGGSKC